MAPQIRCLGCSPAPGPVPPPIWPSPAKACSMARQAV